MTAFTVLVPTYDHAETLWFSLGSLLAQTVQDFEAIVVGDGAPERTAEIVHALADRDRRFRYVANPKGERNGEAARHAALASARGRNVAYLCDDDLWFPQHLETLAALLAKNDLAHTMQINVRVGSYSSMEMFDARAELDGVERMRRNLAGFGLASGAHTLAAYRRLPHGWRPAPPGIGSDTYFWLQFLDQPWCRYVSHKWPEVIHLADVPAGWPATRRAAELAALAAQFNDPAWRDAFVRRTFAALHDRLVGEIRELADSVPAHLYSEHNRYTLGERLLFSRGGNAFRYLISGTHPAEYWGSWLRGPMRVVLPLADEGEIVVGELRLVLELAHFLPPGGREVSRAVVTVGGATVAEIEERAAGTHRYEIAVPAAPARTELAIAIEGLAGMSPQSLGLRDDERELTAAIVALSVGAPLSGPSTRGT